MGTLATPVPLLATQGHSRSKLIRSARERLIMAVLIMCAIFTIVTTIAIISVLTKETIAFFAMEETSVGEFLTGTRWSPSLGAEKHYGVLPLICGTLLVCVVAMSLALPLGLITAIWLSEYAPAAVRGVIKPVLEILAGIPTVVFGYFALTVITPGLQWLHGGPDGFQVYNACSAGLAVGIMCLPLVTSLSEDALRSVPKSLREGAYGLGATRFEVSLRVVTPAALSGIIAAFLLAIARAVGETMIVALAAGSSPRLTIDPRVDVQPMTGYMVQVFLGDASQFGSEYLSSYAVAATLFVMTFMLTIIGHRVRVRFRQVYE
ncbi:MAG: phosphate ABC transporter permease subunit PstC [Phycisphaeraceae bacterium]|nr:phosphate ABC transporter permease subunit PstC [Phycisphaeraceae bacterium]